MTSSEQRLRIALRGLDDYRPSPDLWARVEDAIEEDRAHRRRVWRVAGAVAILLGVLAALGALATGPGPAGRRIDWRVMELLETAALAGLALALGPGIRRFGRGYAEEVFRAHPATGSRFLRLLDLAYGLVMAGYLLLTTSFSPVALATVATQLGAASGRIGGLLLLVGALHAATIAALPAIGLVFTASWRERPSRQVRWVMVAAMVAGGLALLFVAQLLIGLALGVSG